MSTLCLRKLPKHGKATIKRIDASSEMAQRIHEIGLNPGINIEIIGRAPLRDPIAIRVRNFTVALRNNEADHIYVDEL